MSITRRSLLQAAASAGVVGMAPMATRSALAQTPSRITVTSYGGTWEKAVREIYGAFFTRKTGVGVDVVLGGPPQWLAQIESNRQRPPIHVSVMSVELAIEGGRKGLFEKPTVAKVPNLKDIPQQYVDILEGYGACANYGAAPIGYHKDRVKNPPKSFKEMIDRAAKGEFRLALPGGGYPFTSTILLWSLADIYGGGVDNVTPAFEVLKKIRPNVVFWNSVTEFPSLLQTGEADLGIWFDGRIWDAYDAGAKWLGMITPEEGGAMIPTAVVKAVNSPDIAWEYVNSMLDPEPQLAFAKLQNYPVTNQRVVYPPELRERFTPWNKARLPPFAKLMSVIPGWVDRWNREMRG